MKTPTASSATSSQREQTFLLSQVPRSPRSNGCSTPGLENPSASVHPKRFSTPSLTPKFLCAGKLNPRNVKIRLEGIDAPETDQVCLDQHSAKWTCGVAARDRLAERIEGRSIDCTPSGSDAYGRTLAVC